MAKARGDLSLYLSSYTFHTYLCMHLQIWQHIYKSQFTCKYKFYLFILLHIHKSGYSHIDSAFEALTSSVTQLKLVFDSEDMKPSAIRSPESV